MVNKLARVLTVRPFLSDDELLTLGVRSILGTHPILLQLSHKHLLFQYVQFGIGKKGIYEIVDFLKNFLVLRTEY